MSGSSGVSQVVADVGDRWLYGEREAAKLLGISSRTLWSMERTGRIACTRINARKLYSRAAIQAFIFENESRRAVIGGAK